MTLNAQYLNSSNDKLIQENYTKTTATQGKRHIPIPRRRNTTNVQNNQIKIFVISRLASTKQHQHKTLTN